MINYRFKIINKLGEGGSGEVFEVEDTLRDNQRLAMKVLHSIDHTGEATEEAFRNEITRLLELSHPNLIRIFDFGTIRHASEDRFLRRKFFTMEFLSGTDTLTWIAHRVERERREEMLELLMLQTLSVLAYVHREGIIHCDVKPQNLLLADESEAEELPVVKLMDFGFSSKYNDVLDHPIRGTLEYTAPELLSGETFDHRIDLYSLGATFFHLLEGRCAFEARHPIELAKKIVSEEVSYASDSPLQSVIRGLMEKVPARRFPTAEAAARALVEKRPTLVPIFESYFGFARRPKFVGRKKELKTLCDAIGVLKGGSFNDQRTAVVITGPEGIGKTSLLREAVKSARFNDVPVYEMTPLSRDVPFNAIAAIVPFLSSDVRSHSEQGNDLVHRYTPTLGLTAPEGIRFGAWGEQRDLFVEILSRFLDECSAVFPYVIVADKVNAVDEESLRVLRMVLREAPRGRLLVLAAEAGETSTALASEYALHMTLRELDARDVATMSESVMGSVPAIEQVGSALFALYGGTPIIVVEALNALLHLIPVEELQHVESAQVLIQKLNSTLPKDIDEFLLARFRRLSTERQLLLRVLACFQYPVSLEVLYHILPFHPARLNGHVRFLRLDGFLGSADTDRVVYIRLRRLKEAIYAMTGAERVDLHMMISTTLEEKFAQHDFMMLQELAYQHAAAALPAKAALWYERAADAGAEQYVLQRSLQLIEEAIRQAQQAGLDESLRRLKVKMVTLFYRAAMYREAVEWGTRVVQEQDIKPARRATVFKYMGMALSRLGDTEKAEEYINLVLQVSGDRAKQLELRQELVGVQIAAGHFKKAEEESLKQLEIAQQLSNARLLGVIYTDLGIVNFFQDRFDEAVHYFSEALKQYELVNEQGNVVNAINNIGNALSAKGEYAQAIEYWQRALKASLDFGTLNQQAQIYSNLGIAYVHLKDYRLAKKYYDKAIELCKRTGSTVNLAAVLTNLGELHFAEGEYENALHTWREAKQVAEMIHHPYLTSEIALHFVELYSRLGDTKEMEAHALVASRLIQDQKLDFLLPKLWYLHGLCELRKEDHTAARHAFRRVLDSPVSGSKQDLTLLAAIRYAESLFQGGDGHQAVEKLYALRKSFDPQKFPAIAAELEYVLGVIASVKPDLVNEKAIMFFKRGMDAIAKEPVTETTWKLAYALAHEYYERGQLEKAREFLVKTRIVLQFFLSHFKSQELRERYLLDEHKDKVFATIESILGH